MASCFWSTDREAGIALTFGTQVIRPVDKGVKGVITMVERAVYAMARVARKEEESKREGVGSRKTAGGISLQKKRSFSFSSVSLSTKQRLEQVD